MHREDVPCFEVLVNEGGVDVDEPDATKVKVWEKLWSRAAGLWKYPSEVTVLEVNEVAGCTCLGIHKTWSGMTPGQWMHLGQLFNSKRHDSYSFNLESAGDEAYLTIFLDEVCFLGGRIITTQELRKRFDAIRLDFNRISVEC